MIRVIEHDLLQFLQRIQAKKKKPSPQSSNVSDFNSITIQDCEDWIVLDLLHKNLVGNTSSSSVAAENSDMNVVGALMSQRALFYSLPLIYRGDYSRCTNHLNRLVARLNLHQNNNSNERSHHEQHSQLFTRMDLGLSTTGKSLLFGPLQFSISHSSSSSSQHQIIDVSTEPTGHVISTVEGATCSNFIFLSSANVHRLQSKNNQARARLLIVEKEAIARQLISSSSASASGTRTFLQQQLGESTALLCTKGYPCVASRQFISRLVVELRDEVEIFFMGDCDPHGISIYLTVCQMNGANGEDKNKKKNTKTSASAPPPNLGQNILFERIKWVGLKPSTVLAAASSTISSVPWTIADSRCLKSIKTNLENFTTASTASALAMTTPVAGKAQRWAVDLLEELKLMEAKLLKVELEAMSTEDLVKIVCDNFSTGF